MIIDTGRFSSVLIRSTTVALQIHDISSSTSKLFLNVDPVNNKMSIGNGILINSGSTPGIASSIEIRDNSTINIRNNTKEKS